MSIRFRSVQRRAVADLRLLLPRDRALLRILNRTKAATTAQLTALIRSHPRKVQHRLRQLWLAGYLERSRLSPAGHGSSPLAYRLSLATRRRLGYDDPRTAGTQDLQHRLDTVQTVVALAKPTSEIEYPMQAWLTESMARHELAGTQPDAVVALQLGGGSVVAYLEIDEATQDTSVIGRKLLAYRAALHQARGRRLLLFVVPGSERRHWLQRQASAHPSLRGWEDAWVSELGLVDAGGPQAAVWQIGQPHRAVALGDLVDDPLPRISATPVGSSAWLGLLAMGGGEDFDGPLR